MTFNIWTFLFEIVNFVVLAYILHRVLYRPLRAAIERRRAAIAQAQADAEKARDEALAMQKQLESQLADTERQRHEALQKTRELAEAERAAADRRGRKSRRAPPGRCPRRHRAAAAGLPEIVARRSERRGGRAGRAPAARGRRNQPATATGPPAGRLVNHAARNRARAGAKRLEGQRRGGRGNRRRAGLDVARRDQPGGRGRRRPEGQAGRRDPPCPGGRRSAADRRPVVGCFAGRTIGALCAAGANNRNHG